ncbi:MAG: hypothetical protein U0990_09695 [Candidatus Nanopelagicales bacterium]|nr:hypothetical protein [Candidatus Nanopelagicales bacterium]
MSEEHDYLGTIIFGLLMTALGCLIGYSVSREIARKDLLAEAFAAGVGRFVTDPATGDSTFEWGCKP